MKAVRLVSWGLVLLLGIILLFTMVSKDKDGGGSMGPGGPFTLTAHTGEPVSDADFRGKYMLIYFGYSFCPDVCPLELQKMSTALYMLEQEDYDTSLLQPVFISVDPERDTVSELADYVQDFHPSLVALTGTLDEIKAVASQYRVYFKKRKEDGVKGYLMDHQSVIMVMDPDGSFNRIFSSITSPQDIADTFKPVLEKKGG